MDLIIKPTQRCNFGCTFCSSSCIKEDNDELSLDMLLQYIDSHDINTIIVNGGDPLMMPPAYYEAILDKLDEKNKGTLSFTSNLWDFWLHPDKWTPLFKRNRMGVITSFQYGEERRLADGRPYTEEMFRKVHALYKERVGKNLDFITVITKSNEATAIKTVKLAKELGCEVKMNPANASGRCKDYYPKHKMLNIYMDIIEAGLGEYEFNCQILERVFNGSPACCPWTRTCYKGIRCLSPDGTEHVCGSFNDDYIEAKKAGQKTYALDEYPANEIAKDYRSIKSDCFACQMFLLCNGCYKNIKDVKDAHNEVEHCAGMQQVKERMTKLFKRSTSE